MCCCAAVQGPIYCSAVTATLVEHMLGVGSQWLIRLPMDTPVTIGGEPAS